MELQKRDRGSVRTARDIERKYNLGRIAENGKKADMASEQIEQLLEDIKELENQYTLIQEIVNQNKQKINELEENVEQLENSIAQLEITVQRLENNKADKEDLEEYYTKEELEEKLKDLTAGLSSFVRKITYYETAQDFEDSFKMPSYYEVDCLVDVFVNGFKLEKSKYSIDLEGEEYFLNLEDGLDVIGTVVEIDIIQGIKEE